MSVRITPEEMADMYFYRQHFASIWTVKSLVKTAQIGSKTKAYWMQVLSLLEERAERTPNFRANERVEETANG